MELGKRLGSSHELYWKALFSDPQGAGLLRGVSPANSERSPAFDAQVKLSMPDCGLADRPLPDNLLRAAWAVVLSRHTNTEDVLFFASFGDRPPWLAPMRASIPARLSVPEWLAGFEANVSEAEQYGPLPGHWLAQLRENGLLQGLSIFLIAPSDSVASHPPEYLGTPLLVIVRRDISLVEIHYDSACFDHADILALGEHFIVVLHGLANDPQGAVGNLPLLTGAERHQLLVDWNETATPFAEHTRIHEFFQQQAARTPDAVALVFCDRQLTYRELDSQADDLASRLKSAGVGPGAFVAICLNRSLEMLAALLAVFKAGAAYVPLDPAYPPERLLFMIEDARPAVIVVSRQTAELFAGPGQRLFWIDGPTGETAPPAALLTPVAVSDAAYILYTSGSTGKPKGVVVTHRNVSNFFTAMDAVIGPEAGTWLAVTSINFDISVFELFWTLARGFRIILQEEGQWASQSGSKYSLPRQLARHGVTHLQCTPSLASMLVCDDESVQALKSVRRFMVGGEPLPLGLAHRLSEIISGDLFNLYGPTETTVWSAAQLIRPREKQILIGRPVANTRFYVLDAQRELVPIGGVGELYIAGEGLAAEYLHRPDVTAERFVTHTFFSAKPERLYRTGDLVRYTRDGRLEFIGRVDQQIKIRGVRIELGEIEAVLRVHPAIRDAVVVVQEDDLEDKRLIAYLIPSSPPAPALEPLQEWLHSKLPKALVPSAFVFLPEFPKTPNGKLDRRSLPKPEQKKSPAVEGAVNDLERQIAAIWSDALGVESVGVEDRFFDIGGHSLLMVEVHDQISDKTGRRVALLDLFQYPTVRSLARHLGQRPAQPVGESAGMKRGKLRQQVTRHGSYRKAAPLRRPS